ncbi:helix-turn-helix domain-containing protein [Algoriphagus terrigena]|uniref:helix-turn-helix domain-containing protein n=1 Tax=Algoriphagus terrigena TaxID=344884 RepID=UPI00041B8886|nr:AraC family transcriptional regulator [Algoriphagus terrigena]
MTKESLPVYQIPDFEPERFDSATFYYSKFAHHLEKHKFIQKPHKHDFYIVLLITAGSGTHSIDFKEYIVAPGTVFFLHPGQVHSWRLSADSEGHILFFSTQFYSFGFPAKNLASFPFFASSSHPSLLNLQSDQSREIDFYFSEIEKETESSGQSKKEVLRSYTEILLVKLGRIYQATHGLGQGMLPTEDRFKLLEAAIEAHFRTNRHASFYADQLSLSLKQLNRLTKTSVGKTISELLLDRVILESQRLLTYSDATVAEIAAQLGFDDPSYFTRLFRKKIATTPERFRKSVR